MMAEILELPQLIDQHRMAQVQIRSSRVEAGLDSQGLAFFQLFYQLFFQQDVFGTALYQRQRIGNGLGHVYHLFVEVSALKKARIVAQPIRLAARQVPDVSRLNVYASVI